MRTPRVGAKVMLREDHSMQGIVRDIESDVDDDYDYGPREKDRYITYCWVDWNDGSSERVAARDLLRI